MKLPPVVCPCSCRHAGESLDEQVRLDRERWRTDLHLQPGGEREAQEHRGEDRLWEWVLLNKRRREWKRWNTEPWWAEFSHWALSVLYLKIILKVSRPHVNAACQSDLSADNSPHLHFNLQPFCVPLTMEQFDWWRQRRVQKSLRLWNNVCVLMWHWWHHQV